MVLAGGVEFVDIILRRINDNQDFIQNYVLWNETTFLLNGSLKGTIIADIGIKSIYT